MTAPMTRPVVPSREAQGTKWNAPATGPVVSTIPVTRQNGLFVFLQSSPSRIGRITSDGRNLVHRFYVSAPSGPDLSVSSMNDTLNCPAHHRTTS
jgi:hypothetical protein